MTESVRESKVVVLRLSSEALKAFAPSQLDAVEAWAHSNNLWYKFEKLPYSTEYDFANLAPEELGEKGLHTTKLYLGQTTGHKTWALILIYDGSKKRAAKVRFVNETADGTFTTVTDFADLALMYPFRVFKKLGKVKDMCHLKHLIQYIFLDAKQVPKIFQEPLDHFLSQLSAAIDSISKTYDEMGMFFLTSSLVASH